MMVENGKEANAQKRIVIVGGVAGGATAATRLRRLDESAEIVLFEQGPHISYASCGLPYRLGGQIESEEGLLLQTPESLGGRYRLDIRVQHKVLAIDREQKEVTVLDLLGNRRFQVAYDALILAPGAAPIMPPWEGMDDSRIHTVRTVKDVEDMVPATQKGARALIIGGGFIGVEVAENLLNKGMKVSMVEAQDRILGAFDGEMTRYLQERLLENGLSLHVNMRVEGFQPVKDALRVHMNGGEPIDVDMVVLAMGVRPRSELARDAGLLLEERSGGILVNAHMQSSDPSIYAVGDVTAIQCALTEKRGPLALAGPASRQARVAADHIMGRPSRYKGVIGSSIVGAFGMALAQTGLSPAALASLGKTIRKATVHPKQHVSWFPGAKTLHLSLFYDEDGKIWSAAAAGEDGVDKRIDVLSLAISQGLTVDELMEGEFAYAPHFGSPKDPINLVAMVASNDLEGMGPLLSQDALALALKGNHAPIVIDVRDDNEFQEGHIEGALSLPLPELRERIHEIPKDRELVVYCAQGLRGYIAQRILMQEEAHLGKVRNLTGGYDSWRMGQFS